MRQLISNKTKSLPLSLIVVTDADELQRIEDADEILPIGVILQVSTEDDEYVAWGTGVALSETPKIVPVSEGEGEDEEEI